MLAETLVDVLRPYPFRGKGRVLERLVRCEGERTARVFGYRMRLELGELIQRRIWLGDFEPWETRTLRRWLKPGMRFVDVGANVGYFTLLAASRVGAGGRVYAFEPSPEPYAKLASTLKENGIAQAECHPWALGAEEGELSLYFTAPVATNHTPSMVPQEGARRVPVRVRTLDGCLEEWKVERVDVLKLDVEGFEPQVLQGARRSLAEGRIGAVLCELNDAWLKKAGSSAAELYGLLRGHGYRDVSGQGEPRPGTLENRFMVRG